MIRQKLTFPGEVCDLDGIKCVSGLFKGREMAKEKKIEDLPERIHTSIYMEINQRKEDLSCSDGRVGRLSPAASAHN